MTTWGTVSKSSTTWTTYVLGGSFASLAFGSGLFGGGGESSYTAVDKDTDTSFSDVEKEETTWVQQAQSGKVEAQFEYNEPLGGPVWTAVDKDE